MSKVILDNEGTLDKYIGDAIVAFYGAPVHVEDHEKKSCKTALEMQKALGDLRKKWESEADWPDIVYSMQHRIGLNSGKMVTGNMGSEMRMNYTMMGDTVNLAARLESSAKQYGVYNFVGENIYETAKDKYMFRFLLTIFSFTFYFEFRKSSRTSLECPAGFTLGYILKIFPFSFTRNVLLITPMYSLPMNFFFPQTPNAFEISLSTSANNGYLIPILSQNFL